MNLLHIDSSILGTQSASREISATIVARWRDALPGLRVKHMDLAEQPFPHLSAVSLGQKDPEQSARDQAALSDFLAADVIVIGAPMYNFSIPTQLKAWIDRIVVAGKTFRYTASGPQGLTSGKKVIVAISRGSIFAPGAPGEFAESYLRHVFGFVGVRDITVVRAEGLGLSPEHRAKSVNAALAAIESPVAAAA